VFCESLGKQLLCGEPPGAQCLLNQPTDFTLGISSFTQFSRRNFAFIGLSSLSVHTLIPELLGSFLDGENVLESLTVPRVPSVFAKPRQLRYLC